MNVLSTYTRIIKQMLAKLVNIAYIIYIPSIWWKHLFVSKRVEQQSFPTARKLTAAPRSASCSYPSRRCCPHHHHTSFGFPRPFRWKKWGESVRGIGCKSIPEEAGKVGTHSRKVWLYTLAKTNIAPPKKWWFPLGISFCRGWFPRDMLVSGRVCITTTICIWDVQKNPPLWDKHDNSLSIQVCPEEGITPTFLF